jgi:hypothetical protein
MLHHGLEVEHRRQFVQSSARGVPLAAEVATPAHVCEHYEPPTREQRQQLVTVAGVK